MPRNILLLEPKYKNKYPPIGLMKIATYHRFLGDKVEFFKGDIKDLVLEKLTEEAIKHLSFHFSYNNWQLKKYDIHQYIKTKKVEFIANLMDANPDNSLQIITYLTKQADIVRKKQFEKFPKWDRIYVTTLFTFYWKVTVEAIHAAKNLIVDHSQLFVGGVLASLLQNELETETGIKSYPGLLDKPGMLDPGNPIAQNLVIDNMVLDYSILDEIEYEYPTGSAYFTFMTKGCTRKCSFCSVPILEPTYKPKIDTIDKFRDIKSLYGEQQNLLLMDNNVLASPNFPEIVAEIKAMGFYKGATYIEPNQYEISIRNLRNGINDKAYTKRTFTLLHSILAKVKGKFKDKYLSTLAEYSLMSFHSTTKDSLLDSYDELKEIYEKYRSKSSRLRYVDFNQGTDARYVTDELMKLMSEIPIRPLRIAFDYWGMRDKYEKAIRLAAKYEIKELSNYILYNFKDSPQELYKRLEINVLLSEELDIHIYSFPMKFIPLFGEEAKTRDYIGVKWNRKYIRAIQSILNVTKGIVAPGRAFFERAFGNSLHEFEELLHMPETYIVYRKFFEEVGLTQEWQTLYRNLTEEELVIARAIITGNNFDKLPQSIMSENVSLLMRHYAIKRDDVANVEQQDVDYKLLKLQYDKIIKEDVFKNLTLTYDFETDTINKKRMVL
jgi:hypothetical protein